VKQNQCLTLFPLCIPIGDLSLSLSLIFSHSLHISLSLSLLLSISLSLSLLFFLSLSLSLPLYLSLFLSLSFSSLFSLSFSPFLSHIIIPFRFVHLQMLALPTKTRVSAVICHTRRGGLNSNCCSQSTIRLKCSLDAFSSSV
jgi:hypothetical protein